MGFATVHGILAVVGKDFVIKGLQTDEFRGLVEDVLTETGRHNKRDCPLRPQMVIWLVVAMALFRTTSIANVFQRLIRWAADLRLGRRPVTAEALCHARDRLGVLPLKMLHRQIVARILAPVPATFHGLRLWAIDGSEFTVPDTPANLATFGKHYSDRGEAAYPQVRGVLLTALVTHQFHEACFVPSKISERVPVPYLMRNLGSQDLLMVDRGLASFAFFLDCQAQETSFIVRISSTWKPRHLRTLGPGDTLVELIPCKVAWKKLAKKDRHVKIIARMLKFRVGNGEVVRLLTSLLDSTGVPALEVAGQYHLRWECELAYKEVKIELLAVTEGKQKTHLRSKSPIGVLQELWGAVVAHTLVRQLIVEGAEAAGVLPLEISFADSLEVITQSLPAMQSASSHHRLLSGLRAALIKEIGRCLIDRPRRCRQCPRKVKRKMSNFQLKGFNDHEKILDLSVAFIQSPDEAVHPSDEETYPEAKLPEFASASPAGK